MEQRRVIRGRKPAVKETVATTPIEEKKVDLGFSLAEYAEEERQYKLLKKSVEAKKDVIQKHLENTNSEFLEDGEFYASLSVITVESIDVAKLREFVQNDEALWKVVKLSKSDAEHVTNQVIIAKASRVSGKRVSIKVAQK